MLWARSRSQYRLVVSSCADDRWQLLRMARCVRHVDRVLPCVSGVNPKAITRIPTRSSLLLVPPLIGRWPSCSPQGYPPPRNPGDYREAVGAENPIHTP
jgi:hypothetical protein